MIYFSPSQVSFYDDALFGPMEIDVVDDDAYVTAKKEAIAADDVAYEAAKADAGTAEVDRKAFRHHELALLRSPPTKRAPNLDTRLPTDARPVSPTRHADLLEAQGKGQIIVANSDGDPIAIDNEPTADQVVAGLRRRRDAALAASDWTQAPDALTAAKRKLWAEHRKALRDLPVLVEAAMAKGDHPSTIEFPVPPA